MTLLEEIAGAAQHLKAATKLAGDWRVRGVVAPPGTLAQCALHLQKKIAAGKLAVQYEPDQSSS